MPLYTEEKKSSLVSEIRRLTITYTPQPWLVNLLHHLHLNLQNKIVRYESHPIDSGVWRRISPTMKVLYPEDSAKVCHQYTRTMQQQKESFQQQQKLSSSTATS